MAALAVRRGGRNSMVVNPSREFEDIYDRMGQLMNFAFGLTPAVLADMPWVPLARTCPRPTTPTWSRRNCPA